MATTLTDTQDEFEKRHKVLTNTVFSLFTQKSNKHGASTGEQHIMNVLVDALRKGDDAIFYRLFNQLNGRMHLRLVATQRNVGHAGAESREAAIVASHDAIRYGTVKDGLVTHRLDFQEGEQRVEIRRLVDEWRSRQTELVIRLEARRCLEEACRGRTNDMGFVQYNAMKGDIKNGQIGAVLSLLGVAGYIFVSGLLQLLELFQVVAKGVVAGNHDVGQVVGNERQEILTFGTVVARYFEDFVLDFSIDVLVDLDLPIAHDGDGANNEGGARDVVAAKATTDVRVSLLVLGRIAEHQCKCL